MKRILIAALCAASLSAMAQTQQQQQQLQSANEAAAVNQGVTTQVLTFGADRNHTDWDTNQAHSAASSFATSAVWRCATSGTGFAAQIVGGGISYAGKGGESDICVVEYRLAVNKGVDAALADPKTTPEQKAVILALACGDTDLANAYEGTTKQCPDMTDREAARKARHEREREARNRAAVALGEPVVTSRVAQVAYLP